MRKVNLRKIANGLYEDETNKIMIFRIEDSYDVSVEGKWALEVEGTLLDLFKTKKEALKVARLQE